MKKLALVAVIALIAIVAFALNAYAANETVVVTARTNAKITLSVDDTSQAFGTFDPDVPQTLAPAFTVSVKSNKVYNYYMTAPAAFTGGSTPAISSLEFNRAGWTTFAAGNNDVLNGETKTAGRDYDYDLRLTFGYDVDPDADYSADIVPTALQ